MRRLMSIWSSYSLIDSRLRISSLRSLLRPAPRRVGRRRIALQDEQVSSRAASGSARIRSAHLAKRSVSKSMPHSWAMLPIAGRSSTKMDRQSVEYCRRNCSESGMSASGREEDRQLRTKVFVTRRASVPTYRARGRAGRSGSCACFSDSAGRGCCPAANCTVGESAA
jgi:hypothetical protein